MWIEHIGTIGMAAVIVLIIAHFAVHFYFKVKKRRQHSKQSKQ
ncbi:hypothetical protein [Thiomicrorhabdus sp.]|nr:hypothetical protein [Thiomicrorhabdus sp.]